MRHQKEEEYMSGNLTAMIDVVFQLIIFFVCTISMQEQTLNTGIKLAMAPNGAPVVKKDPREILIDVDRGGRVTISRQQMSQALLTSILSKTRADSGGAQIPIIVRGDASASHKGIKSVMDACANAGIYKIKFAAMKEKGS